MVSATHIREDLEFALQTLADVARACRIISGLAKAA